MAAVRMGNRGAQRKGYPILQGAEPENLSAKVLTFKLNLKGNIKFCFVLFFDRQFGEGWKGHCTQGLLA